MLHVGTHGQSLNIHIIGVALILELLVFIRNDFGGERYEITLFLPRKAILLQRRLRPPAPLRPRSNVILWRVRNRFDCLSNKITQFTIMCGSGDRSPLGVNHFSSMDLQVKVLLNVTLELPGILSRNESF